MNNNHNNTGGFKSAFQLGNHTKINSSFADKLRATFQKTMEKSKDQGLDFSHLSKGYVPKDASIKSARSSLSSEESSSPFEEKPKKTLRQHLQDKKKIQRENAKLNNKVQQHLKKVKASESLSQFIDESGDELPGYLQMNKDETPSLSITESEPSDSEEIGQVKTLKQLANAGSSDSSDDDLAQKQYNNKVKEMTAKGVLSLDHVSPYSNQKLAKIRQEYAAKAQQKADQTLQKAKPTKEERKEKKKVKTRKDELLETLMFGIQPDQQNHNNQQLEYQYDLMPPNSFGETPNESANSKISAPQISFSEHKRIMEEQNRQQQAEMQREIRFAHRKDINSLLKPLLNGDLFDSFDSVRSFPQLPIKYESHELYRSSWEFLFQYEVMCQLSSGRGASKKEAPVNAGLENFGSALSQQATLWVAYCVTNVCHGEFLTLKMYLSPPYQRKNQENDDQAQEEAKEERDLNKYVNPRKLREHDLLLLTQNKLKLNDNDIKRLAANPSELRKLLHRGHVTALALVNAKSTSQTGNTSFELLTDSSKKFMFENAQETNHYSRFYCYFFDSLATTFREFKSIRQSEFFNQHLTKQILTQPAPTKICPPFGSNQEDHVRVMHMNQFLEANRAQFNQSQFKVLQQVSKMPVGAIQLIQGPPGTGKTQTVSGLLSMLINAGVDKVHVCAPSNAAVDEILTRVATQGLLTNEGKALKDTAGLLLRVGAMEYEPTDSVKLHTLDERVKETMNDAKEYDLKSKIDACEELIYKLASEELLQASISRHQMLIRLSISDTLKGIRKFCEEPPSKQKSKLLDAKKRFEQQQNDLLKNRGKQPKGDWKYAEASLILKSKILFTTLSMAGIDKFEVVKNQVDYLIVDEACQATELSCLIPFELNPKRVILVGDQNQLPATTFSENAHETGYSRSLFERMHKGGTPKLMLTIQYRMHPFIRQFPGQAFYQNKITDGESVLSRSLSAPLQNLSNSLRRSIFFDLQASQELQTERSKHNQDECQFTLQLVKFIIARANNNVMKLGPLANSIAIITPYKAQVSKLKTVFSPWLRLINARASDIEINTVDAFQGREKDIVIFNCVRANKLNTVQASLGFLTDKRRLNVAITRPRHFLFMVGNSKTLVKDQVFQLMIKSYQQSEGGYLPLDEKVDFYTDKIIGEILDKQIDHGKRMAELEQAGMLGLSDQQIQVKTLMKRAHDQIESESRSNSSQNSQNYDDEANNNNDSKPSESSLKRARFSDNYPF